MTSEQVRLILAAVLVVAGLFVTGCTTTRTAEPPLVAPYATRQVWAVVPLRNESGSRGADGFRMADRLVYEFEQVQGIDVLPVNRVLQAMQTLELDGVRTREDAIALRELLGVDGLVVGSITAYDPYDPVRIGLALDLYTDALTSANPLDLRGLSWAPTADAAGMQLQTLYRTEQPVATVSGVFSAASPSVKRRISAYAAERGTSGNARHNERMITIDMNLYSEFVGHEMGSRLMWAEWQRLARQRAQAVSTQAEAQTDSP
ncbi:MAG: hypothetical protein AAGA29_01250 [Planctomycetota bacterium]